MRSVAGDAGVVGKSVPEHDEMRRLIARLRETRPEEAGYDATVMELMRDVLHHVADEETILLPDAERLLADRLEDLGSAMTKRRLELVAPRSLEPGVEPGAGALPASNVLMGAGALALVVMLLGDMRRVGAGFAGSVLAERLASVLGQRVLIVDKRPHIGGNAYDHYDDAGVLVHPYGPHIFHTNSAEIFEYLSQFTEWRPYQHRVLASVDGQLVPIPINLDTVNRLYGLNLTSFEIEEFFASVAEKVRFGETSEDVVVSKVGRELYNKFFRGYTRKQWGLDPSELDASVTARVPARTNRDDRYFTDTLQAMPLHGYTRMFENMLDHPNIKVMLNTDYREIEGSTCPYERHDLHRARSTSSSTTATASCRIARSSSSTRRSEEQFQPVAGGQLSERLRLHADHRVQAPDRAGTSEDVGRLRVPARRGRPVLPGAAPGERRALQAVQGAGRGAPGRTSSAGWRPTSTTTWTRSSASRWRPSSWLRRAAHRRARATPPRRRRLSAGTPARANKLGRRWPATPRPPRRRWSPTSPACRRAVGGADGDTRRKRRGSTGGRARRGAPGAERRGDRARRSETS